MALRWHTVVIDCRDLKAQAEWWATVLDWKILHQADDECVIVPPWVDDAAMRTTPRERIGPGMVFVHVDEPKSTKNRLHFDLAPQPGHDHDTEVTRLERLGATRTDIGQPPDAPWTVLTDPEGNEFCVLSSNTP
jgi:Glyoxalase-like domain